MSKWFALIVFDADEGELPDVYMDESGEFESIRTYNTREEAVATAQKYANDIWEGQYGGYRTMAYCLPERGKALITDKAGSHLYFAVEHTLSEINMVHGNSDGSVAVFSILNDIISDVMSGWEGPPDSLYSFYALEF
jgi:hypothetical protein